MRGIGDLVNPGFALFGPTNRIRVQIDGLTGTPNGRYGDAADGMIEYEVDTVNNRVVFDPNTAVFGDKEILTDGVIIVDGSFQVGGVIGKEAEKRHRVALPGKDDRERGPPAPVADDQYLLDVTTLRQLSVSSLMPRVSYKISAS